VNGITRMLLLCHDFQGGRSAMLGFPRMASLSALSFERNLSIWFSFLFVMFGRVFHLSSCLLYVFNKVLEWNITLLLQTMLRRLSFDVHDGQFLQSDGLLE
jgi:hypothetical protein